ncbi:MAG TPA: FAD-dependent oxidoreductase, partial [Bryobacteraceae bacterium]|nr:FAD-dependent oxidoreductase [Bryobacteraceae bacterium]
MTYDVVVIGSGPGGYSAAVRAGQYGLKAALIEKQTRLGGTCLLVGCIPTKSLLHTADVWDYFKNPEAQGISAKDPQLNYPKVLDRKNKIVSKHSKGIEFLMRKNKVDVIKGTARLLGGGRIEVTSGSGKQIVESKNIL